MTGVLQQVIAESSLTQRECDVIEWRFDRGRTLDVIASDLGLTRERIRQIEAKAVRKLKKKLTAPENEDLRREFYQEIEGEEVIWDDVVTEEAKDPKSVYLREKLETSQALLHASRRECGKLREEIKELNQRITDDQKVLTREQTRLVKQHELKTASSESISDAIRIARSRCQHIRRILISDLDPAMDISVNIGKSPEGYIVERCGGIKNGLAVALLD